MIGIFFKITGFHYLCIFVGTQLKLFPLLQISKSDNGKLEARISFSLTYIFFTIGQIILLLVLVINIEKGFWVFIILMQELQSKQSFQELQFAENNDHSPDSLVKEPVVQKNPSKKAFTFNIKRCMFLIFMVISSTILLAEINALQEEPFVQPTDFEFYVYCPYSYRNSLKPFSTPEGEGYQYLRRRLYEKYSYSVQLASPGDNPEYNLSNLYVVEMRSINITKADDIDPTLTLAYCGLATRFNSTCDDQVQVVCSSPGPMFDLTVGQHTDIVWINSFNSSIVPSSSDGSDSTECMMDQTNPRCTLPLKQNAGQTYNDPTQHVNSIDQIQITQNNWPTSPHVHGAEVRPTFDGNPISWVDNNGHRGLGAFTMKDECYYDSFDQGRFGDNSTFLPPDIIVKNVQQNYTISHVKINRYPNIQNPGNLWYHDHAMRLTKYNVQKGLNGLYILRDQKVQQEINVDKSHQKFVMIAVDGWKSSHNLNANFDQAYRFRFVNNNFADFGTTIYFTYEKCGSNNKKISFTIIGADSSLVNRGIENVTSFIISSAERIELLIKFQNVSSQYSICEGNKSQKVDSQQLRSIQKISLHKNFESNSVVGRTSISDVKLSVAYVDLSKKTPVKLRMRPLLSINGIMTINGRTDFHGGKSEDPTIGTVEDWYIINAMNLGHPIHFHLVNFQVTQILNLRKYQNIPQTGSKIQCSIYELDFMFQAILKSSVYPTDSPAYYNRTLPNYPYICANKVEIYGSWGFHELLETVNVENVFNQKNVSGIDVNQHITEADKTLFKELNVTFNPTDVYKYIDNKIAPPTKQYYSRWKDTALVEAFQVSVLRIRWAKSAYDENNNKNDDYFNVPADQLREYPGFLYHCHILKHEDNEMMRPIMLQLPKNAKLDPKTPCNKGPDSSWEKKVECINQRCKDRE